MINDKSKCINQTHSCVMNIHGTYPQFCRLSCSLLPQVSVKDAKSLNSLARKLFCFADSFSLNWHARRCTKKLRLLAKILILFQSFFFFVFAFFFQYEACLFNPHVARHKKWIFFPSQLLLCRWAHHVDISESPFMILEISKISTFARSAHARSVPFRTRPFN